MPVACFISAPLRDFDLIALATALHLHGQARSPSKSLQRGFFRLVFHTDLLCSSHARPGGVSTLPLYQDRLRDERAAWLRRPLAEM